MPPIGQRAPGLTGRENWGRYALGLVTEVAAILGTALLALVLAAIAQAVL